MNQIINLFLGNEITYFIIIFTICMGKYFDVYFVRLIVGWNELLIAAFSHRSTVVKDGILLATGLHVHRSSAHQAGVGTIFDRVLTELVAKMREMKMDKTEVGCLRAIVLYNPGMKQTLKLNCQGVGIKGLT